MPDHPRSRVDHDGRYTNAREPVPSENSACSQPGPETDPAPAQDEYPPANRAPIHR
jgi:hypothetical protein